MPTTFESDEKKYLHCSSPAQRTREEFATTLRNCSRWGGTVSLEHVGTKEIREFLDWVHEDASRQGRKPRQLQLPEDRRRLGWSNCQSEGMSSVNV